MIQAQIYRQNSYPLGNRWICRLYEPGGYCWHGQVAHTCFEDITKDEFIDRCKKLFGEFTLTA